MSDKLCDIGMVDLQMGTQRTKETGCSWRQERDCVADEEVGSFSAEAFHSVCAATFSACEGRGKKKPSSNLVSTGLSARFKSAPQGAWVAGG